MDDFVRSTMYDVYQSWVMKAYGDETRTKTITLKKRLRIFRILRGEEQLSAENSKFRFWVRNKGFRIGPPEGYIVKPADAIVGRNNLEGEKDDLYVPGGNKDIGSEYKKVAIVENFFDIIYAVHVEIDGRFGKHAGQKKTYRTITETFAFLPREAVTKFLVNCSECQKGDKSLQELYKCRKSAAHPNRSSWKVLENLLPNRSMVKKMSKPRETKVAETTESSSCEVSFVSEQSSPENLSRRDRTNETANGEPPYEISVPKMENYVLASNQVSSESRENVKPRRELLDYIGLKQDTTIESDKTRIHEGDDGKASVQVGPESTRVTVQLPEISAGSDTSDSSSENLRRPKYFRKPFEIRKLRRGIFERNRIGEATSGNKEKTFPICYPLPRSDGCRKTVLETKTAEEVKRRRIAWDEVTAGAESESAEEETPYSGTKEAEKLKMMLLAWSGSRNGDRMPEEVSDDATQIWTGYHNALSLSKQAPQIRSSPTQETGSVHDETSSSGNKDDDDDEEEEPEEKIDPLKYDPERLKAFNMFVRLFVDENLDRIVPISKQPKEKIQAIIDSCTRQFPEFSERARKRIRTYLKSCRRNKRTREGNSAWEPQSRPTPAHLTSVQAEQILAQACENESHNAKRMRLGLEPVTQPMPGMTTDTSTTVRSQGNSEGTRERDHYTSPVSSTNTVEKHSAKHEPNSGSVSPTVQNKSCSLEALAMASANSLSPSLLNGSAPPSSVAAAVAAAAAAPTAMYRPNFSQAFQRATAGGTYTTPGLFSLPCSLTNGTRPTDLSMKNKPLLTHKLNPAEMTAVRQLITGYRESAAFLLRSADELEQLLRNQ